MDVSGIDGEGGHCVGRGGRGVLWLMIIYAGQMNNISHSFIYIAFCICIIIIMAAMLQQGREPKKLKVFF